MRGSLLTIFNQFAGQGMRIGGNLLLTRLLFPEAFGLMALVQVVIRGVEMFSDVGVRGSIIFNKRGKDPVFLDTAWTVQIIRGGILTILVALLAVPAAHFYEEPALVWLLPAVGVTPLIRGFASTSRHSLTREVVLGKLVRLDLTAQAMGLVTMVGLALIWKSVWALALGGLVAALATTLMSHHLIPGYRNRFRYEKSAARSLFHFGKWIFFAVLFAFLIEQADRLVLGRVVTAAELGVYSVAAVVARMVTRMISKLSFSVLQPVFARLHEQDRKVMRAKILRMRALVLAAALPPLWFLAVFGDRLIELLYDERYIDAGWMVKIVAVGAIGSVVAGSTERVILSSGDSFRWMLLQASRTVILVLGIWGGFYYGEGIPGLLTGIAASRFVSYLPLAYFLRRYGAWLPGLDLAAFAVSAGVIWLGRAFF